MQITQIMSSPAVTAPPRETLHEIVGTMLRHRIGSVVVVDPGVVGILTRSDVLRTQYRAETPLPELTARDAMTDDVVTIQPSTSIDAALETMAHHTVKKLPVIDGIDLAGIVTMTDIARSQPERVSEIRSRLERKDEWTD
ncbi:CBS domain-containing protein [Halopiger djelfimassiliensis]|uniref:CBS domain-containing protein n=1 Tax=Halopiger djelfimassiliensis TaxID=1293047 RepID=UPI0006779879|nr:CBS domain-containing protein [Halopiger djelfimassiliensis]